MRGKSRTRIGKNWRCGRTSPWVQWDGRSVMSPEQEKDEVPPVVTKPREKKRPKSSKPLPPYHVVLLDDNEHTVEYVVEMMLKLFGYPPERGLQIAIEVDTRKRVIVY